MRPETTNENWTAIIVGRLHLHRITQVQLANRCGYSPEYLCTVLNGKKTFKSAQAKERTKGKIFDALEELESESRGVR